MKTIILFDNHDNYAFLEPLFDCVIYSPLCKKNFFSWLMGAFITLYKSKKEDTITCWFDFQAVLLFWLSFIFLKKRKIICLNILLKDKPTLKNRIVSFLYKIALSSKNFKATITSNKYGLFLNKKFGRNYKYILLHDVFHSYYEFPCYKIKPYTKSVFCGGRNGRDWKFMISIATQLPDICFKFVMPRDAFDNYKSSIPSNVDVIVDVTYEIFIQTMLQCQLVALPLDTEAPAGLIVLFQAIANERPFVISRTAATEGYIFNHDEFFLSNDVFLWKEKINDIVSDYDTWIIKIKDMKKVIEEECNEQKFKTKIKEITNE